MLNGPSEARLEPEVHAALLDVLGDARRLGHLGPGELQAQIDRSLALCQAVAPPTRGTIVDLGSGGGLPGLVMAGAWPSSRWLLLDGRQLRSAFLTEAVRRLGWTDRIEVLGDRAERAGRGAWRGRSPLVVARGFAGPAVTAECAAPLLELGGRLVVTDPPGGDDGRWPDSGLAEFGLVRERSLIEPVALQVIRLDRPCPAGYPRRVGVPAKQPRLLSARHEDHGTLSRVGWPGWCVSEVSPLDDLHRLRMVRLIVDKGVTIEAAADRFQVDPRPTVSGGAVISQRVSAGCRTDPATCARPP